MSETLKYVGQGFNVMRLLQISDVHGSFDAVSRTAEKAKGFDAIIVAGDITHFGSIPQAETLLGKLAETGLDVFFVAGNCDHPSLLSWTPRNPRIVNLHLRKIRFGGFELVGLAGGNISPFNTYIEFSEDQIASMLSTLNPSSPNFILISHTPPYGADADIGRGTHLGSTAVREYVEKHKPLAVCCGHIHEARSISMIGRTKVVNAGPSRDGFCASLKVAENDVEVELLRL
ncbi:MAG: metallophosphoesterase [Candidatus Caldarchaeum sp.]